mgnify:CR=1 FL=1|tara:strand:- start:390 stop:1337 length:948 start_codon:yes stop_codon:yes gene_type:complete
MAENYGALGAFNKQGQLNIPTQAAADYIAKQGQVTSEDKTMRQKAVDYSADAMIGLGMEPHNAYKYSRKFLGDERAPNIVNSIGLADVTPAGLVFGADEAVRDYGKAESGLDYIAPTVGLGLSVLEAYPLTKIITKPLRGFLSSLGKKTSPVVQKAPVDQSRRDFVAGAAAVPIAVGALNTLPLGKIAPKVAKVARLSIPKGFNFSSLNSFTNRIEDAKDLAIAEGRAADAEMLDDVSIGDLIDGGDFDEDEVLQMVSEMKAKFPGASDKEIYDELANISDDAAEVLGDIFDEDGGLLSVIKRSTPEEINLADRN